MKALIVDTAGATPRLADGPEPAPGPGEIAVAVTAAALNFADLLMIEGRYQDMPPYPLTPGLELAGRVRALGAGVSGVDIGDRVAAFAGHGGLAESAIVPAQRVLRLPDTMPDEVGAAFQIAYGTSHLALTRRARLAPGETLAVLGAAGGVGLTAVEIGKALGARVIAVARGADRLKVAAAAGADVLVDSAATPDLRAALRDAGPPDVIYDAVGGPDGEAAMRALRPEGRHLLIGFASGDLPALRPNHLLVKNIDVIGLYWGGYLGFAPEVLRDSLATLMDWHARGRIRPHISHRFPLAQAAEALDLLRSRKATGKIVVTP